MAVIHGINAAVYWGHPSVATTPVDISGRGNDVGLTIDMPLADITGFGSVAKSFVAGQYGWKVTLKAFYDSTGTLNTDGLLGSCITSTTAGSIVICPEGSVTGHSFWKGSAFLTNYVVTSNLGGGVSITASFQGTGPVTRAIAA